MTVLGIASFNAALGLGTPNQRWVGQAGSANSMCAKMDAANDAAARGHGTAKQGAINAYIHEVQAQTGKPIPARDAEALIRLAQALRSRLRTLCFSHLPPHADEETRIAPVQNSWYRLQGIYIGRGHLGLESMILVLAAPAVPQDARTSPSPHARPLPPG